MNKSAVEQPAPTPNSAIPIADLVIQDMQERKQLGIKQYGTPLQANNGRDALMDAYQEAIDLCMYLRQAIEERGDRPDSSSVIREIAENAIEPVCQQIKELTEHVEAKLEGDRSDR